jgi:NADPH:quinone reductase
MAASTRAVVLDGPPDTLRCVRVHGDACFTGMLCNQWTIKDFWPIDYLPRGVRLAAYGGEFADPPPQLLQGFLDSGSRK